VTQRPHEAKWTHELIGGAAAYEAAKAYEEHSARNGKSIHTLPTRSRITNNPAGEPDSHAKAKEFLAGAIGAFVDREVETRGLDFIDKEEAKRHGRRHAEEQLSQNSNW
jgi:hypothetical protein